VAAAMESTTTAPSSAPTTALLMWIFSFMLVLLV
jgi:hypothetical protein